MNNSGYKDFVHVFADFVDKRAAHKAFVHNISKNVDEIHEVRRAWSRLKNILANLNES